MSWTGRVFNQDGDMLFIRGGAEGFDGAYIKLKNGREIKIEHTLPFEIVEREKAKQIVLVAIERVLEQL